jgi:hypothetical protein
VVHNGTQHSDVIIFRAIIERMALERMIVNVMMYGSKKYYTTLSTSSDLIYRVMSVWITRRANYLDLK